MADDSTFWATCAQVSVVLLLAVTLEVRWLLGRRRNPYGLAFFGLTLAGLLQAFALFQGLIYMLPSAEGPAGSGAVAAEILVLMLGALVAGIVPLFPNYNRPDPVPTVAPSGSPVDAPKAAKSAKRRRKKSDKGGPLNTHASNR